MSKFTFLKLAEVVLSEERTPLTGLEIWEIAKQKGYDLKIESSGKTPWKSVEAQIYSSLKYDTNSIFIKEGTKPRKFFLKNVEEDLSKENLDLTENKSDKQIKYLEKDMHPFLSYYELGFHGVLTKTIDHKRSKRKSFNQWLHPDIVGIYLPVGDWTEEALDLSKILGGVKIKLYSFELKRKLGFQNLREAFFQTVSNSSWANEGYLVAAEIDDSDDFQQELCRLSTSFGIGIIKIDMNDPNSSKILYPAKYKNGLDWESINKLSEENYDFKDFLINIKTDLDNKEPNKEFYDKVYDNVEDLKESIK